jgi:hypothetical protein
MVVMSDTLPPPDSMVLRDISSMTFKQGEMTVGNYRRGSVPQLVCVGGNATTMTHSIKEIRCDNVGADGSVVWKCDSQQLSLHSLVLGKTRVDCDNYANIVSPYVRKGSCYLEYTLDSIGKAFPHPPLNDEESVIERIDYNSFDQIGLFLIILIMIGILLTVVVKLYIKIHVPEERKREKYTRKSTYTNTSTTTTSTIRNRRERRRHRREEESDGESE